MRPSRLPVLLPAALLFPPSLAVASDVITNGTWRVEVGPSGVLVGHPPRGLHTVDGPRVDFVRGFAEWWGVSYEGASGAVQGVGVGNEPDWARRKSAEVLYFAAAGDSAVSVTRVGDLEVETVFQFLGPYLTVTARLVNRGNTTLHNVFYSREWRGPGLQGWTFPPDMAVLPAVPADVCRVCWMLDDLPPGASQGVSLSYTVDDSLALTTPPVPLALWTGPGFPAGIPIGTTYGISWGDYDKNGWIDIFACNSGNLWRNLGGTSWQLVANLGSLIPAGFRYGAAFGDYNNDGLPDIATEPRAGGGDTCLHLLRNLGGGPSFVDVATNPAIIGLQACGADSETITWGDVDGDGDLDFFLPVYPPWVSGPGNFFYRNLGPTGPGGAYHFAEMSAAGGLDNPPGSARPEGADFCDIDGDGDLDLYSNGTIYQNRSLLGVPDFDALSPAVSGNTQNFQLDEGAKFFDYDMDGDYDLAIAYVTYPPGVMVWENRGDGKLFNAGATVVLNPSIGLGLGLSAEDWDNDGDVDLTTKEVFRRNTFVETGQRQFVQSLTSTINPSFLTSATPAWGDWDKDGDLDCAIGNFGSTGHFYQNTTYGPATPFAARRYVRVRPLLDSATLPAGLENEYGASVEIRIAGGAPGGRRRKFTSSADGYLNQNEYALHFGLPADPDPGNPLEDLRFDVVADFPSLPSQGYRRVDRTVNPALGNLDLADLSNREIQVFRSGRVRINGTDLLPSPTPPSVLTTTTGGLILPTATIPVPAPALAPAANHFVGLDFDTSAAPAPFRMKEILLDGQLDAPVSCGADAFNLFLWDVTDPASPVLAAGAALTTSIRNHRAFFPVKENWILQPLRRYRLLARVTQLRSTPVAAPIDQGAVTVLGGLSFQDSDPCAGAGAASAFADPTKVYLAFRFAPDAGAGWVDIGNGVAGSGGIPLLEGAGVLAPGEPFRVSLTGAAPNASVCFVIGLSAACFPAPGGVVVPAFDLPIGGAVTDANGEFSFLADWPSSLPSGFVAFFQVWVLDTSGPQGLTASNAVASVLQH